MFFFDSYDFDSTSHNLCHIDHGVLTRLVQTCPWSHKGKTIRTCRARQHAQHAQFTVLYLPDLADGNHTMAEAVSYRGFSNNREICINKCMFDRNGSVQDFS